MAFISIRNVLAQAGLATPAQFEEWSKAWRVAVENGSQESLIAFFSREGGLSEEAFLQRLAQVLGIVAVATGASAGWLPGGTPVAEDQADEAAVQRQLLFEQSKAAQADEEDDDPDEDLARGGQRPRREQPRAEGEQGPGDQVRTGDHLLAPDGVRDAPTEQQ